MSRANLELIFNQATEADLAVGMDSWFHYNRLMATIGERTGFGVATVTGVFASLSPNNDYMGNLRDAVRLLKAKREGLRVDQVRVSTYNPNKVKAWAIASGENPLKFLIAPKTRNFYSSIVDPHDRSFVTVDGHIFNIYAGRRVALTEVKEHHLDYDEVALAISEMADDLGLIPNQVQGVLWYTWKRIHRIKWDAQLELIPGDVFVAQNYKPTIKQVPREDPQLQLQCHDTTGDLFRL